VPARVLTAGETMALLDPVEDGPLSLGRRLVLRFAGAESNFAIALARLGVEVTWISRLGDDPLGAIVRDALAAEGIDLRYVRTDADAPTGLFLKWREAGRSYPLYYRRGSAASRLQPEDVPDDALEGVELVHLTGITTALGDGARSLVVDLARRAKARGITVTFDPNLRPALWSSAAEAAAVQSDVLSDVDWYLCGLDEGRALFGADTAAGVVEAAREAGAGDAVVRTGDRGAFVHGQEIPLEQIAKVVDEVGAGDAFDAGFAYGCLQGWAPAECARFGNRIAAEALGGTGDWETLPHLADLDA
jgi:sugar/nucleoside kinase (ribokinase family)